MLYPLLKARTWRTLLTVTFIFLLTVSPQVSLARLTSPLPKLRRAETPSLQIALRATASSLLNYRADSFRVKRPRELSGIYLKRASSRNQAASKLRAIKVKATRKPLISFDQPKALASLAALPTGVAATGEVVADGKAGVDSGLAPPANSPSAPADITAAPPAADEPQFKDPETQRLYELIRDTRFEKMDLDFYKKVYSTYKAAKHLKEIFGLTEGDFPAKNRRLGNLRKWYDWSEVQAPYARNKNVVIENTNQGKDNGARSDLDATANILEMNATGDHTKIKEGAVADLVRYHEQHYKNAGLIGVENVDVTLFNGDTWLPDWRDSRMSYDEFKRQMNKNVWDLKNRKGAYFVPGAHKEQAHDRGLAEGHTVHIGWDYIGNRPMVNGRPVEWDSAKSEIVDAETKQPIQEYTTREEALRYRGLEGADGPNKWRRSFGNIVQNMGEFLHHDEPINRNKYFIERFIDQGAGRFTHLSRFAEQDKHTYVEVHAADTSKMSEERKTEWKRAFIQQAFDIAPGNGQKIDEIRSVLDRAAEIQLDKTKQRADYKVRARDPVNGYYKDEMKEAEENVKKRLEAEGKSAGPDFDDLKVKEAERLFVEKQRALMIEGGVRVVAESFHRDFTPEGRAEWNRDIFKNPEVAKKILFERGIELAFFMDLIESAPGLDQARRDQFKERVLNAIPENARPLAVKLAELSRLKLDLIGRTAFKPWLKGRDGKPDPRPAELIAQVEQDIKRLLGEVDNMPPSVSPDDVRKAIIETIYYHLGPEQQKEFKKAWEEGKRAMVVKYGGSAYLNEIKDQFDFLAKADLALSMVSAFQQHCANQSTALNEECLSGLGKEAFHQGLYALPGINTGLTIMEGLKNVNEGKGEGFISVVLGTLSLPSFSQIMGFPGFKLFLLYQFARTGKEITYGYAIQAMENDAEEQAFKAVPEPGKQARRFNYPNQPWSINRADTPTTPLLSDVIRVEADQWGAVQRDRVALEKFAPAIEQDMQEARLKFESDEWYTKRNELFRHYGDLLPYTQRMEQIYKHFSPKVEQLIAQLRGNGNQIADQDPLALKSCLEVREEKVEEKYKAPPSLWDRLRFWRNPEKDKATELAQVRTVCLKQSLDREAWIKGVFNKYLDGWYGQQHTGYRSTYDTPEMRERLSSKLMNEYIWHRHLALGFENERQLKKTAVLAKEQADTRTKVVANVLSAQNQAKKELQQNLDQAAAQAYQGDPPEVKPELKLQAPDHAVRLGAQSAFVDIAARGQYYRNEEKNKWKTVLTSEIANVTLERPDNLVLTKDLEDEMQKGGKTRRFITVDEKLTGELRDEQGNKLATAETTARYYDLLPEWRGYLRVPVRSKDGKPYWGKAKVKISGPVNAEETATSNSLDYEGVVGSFSNLPPGTYSITVEPHPDDAVLGIGKATVTLRDYTPVYPLNSGAIAKLDGQVFSIRGKDSTGQDGEVILVNWNDSVDINVQLGAGNTDTASIEKGRIDAAQQIAEYNRDVKAGRVAGPIIRAKGATATTPTVEAIPEDTRVTNPRTNPVATEAIRKPVVEAIPEDANAARNRPSPSISTPARKRTVEEIPEPATPASRRNTPPPQVEAIPEDNRIAANRTTAPLRKPTVEVIPEPNTNERNRRMPAPTVEQIPDIVAETRRPPSRRTEEDKIPDIVSNTGRGARQPSSGGEKPDAVIRGDGSAGSTETYSGPTYEVSYDAIPGGTDLAKGYPTRGFGDFNETDVWTPFHFSFSPPPNIVGAKIIAFVKPIGADIATDRLAVKGASGKGYDVNFDFAKLAVGQWSTITVKLEATDVLAAIRNGRLEGVVQDDTAVGWVKLIVITSR